MIYLVLGIISDLQKTNLTLWNWLKHQLERTTKLFTVVFLYIFLKNIRSSIHLVKSLNHLIMLIFIVKLIFFLFGRTFLHDYLDLDCQRTKLWIELSALVIVYSFFLLNTFYKNINKKWELKNIHETWHTKNLKHFQNGHHQLSMNISLIKYCIMCSCMLKI